MPPQRSSSSTAGLAAIVMRSLFEEQIQAEAMAAHRAIDLHTDSSAEAATYFADPADFVIGPGEYVEHLHRVKHAVAIPVIASLNGSTNGGWLEYATLMEQAGADAIELNVYSVATDPETASSEIEHHAIEMVREVKEAVKIPLPVKLSRIESCSASCPGPRGRRFGR